MSIKQIPVGVFLLGGDQLQLFGDAAHLLLLKLPTGNRLCATCSWAPGCRGSSSILLLPSTPRRGGLLTSSWRRIVVAGMAIKSAFRSSAATQEGWNLISLLHRMSAGSACVRPSTLPQEQLQHCCPSIPPRSSPCASSMPQRNADRLRPARSVAAELRLFVRRLLPVFMNIPAT